MRELQCTGLPFYVSWRVRRKGLREMGGKLGVQVVVRHIGSLLVESTVLYGMLILDTHRFVLIILNIVVE